MIVGTDNLFEVDVDAGLLADPLQVFHRHPLGDGRLLGIGQDATDEGRTLGAKVSLFDVSDPSDPKEVDSFTL
ncbi:MAG: beta-propeller domain-containing protein, partial [Acidimicrobiia bacterium]|nr:beta-propeller domain-containing protein [Acidimicrobiia bacterium]